MRLLSGDYDIFRNLLLAVASDILLMTPTNEQLALPASIDAELPPGQYVCSNAQISSGKRRPPVKRPLQKVSESPDNVEVGTVSK